MVRHDLAGLRHRAGLLDERVHDQVHRHAHSAHRHRAGPRNLCGHALVGAQGQGPLHHPGGGEDDARAGGIRCNKSRHPGKAETEPRGQQRVGSEIECGLCGVDNRDRVALQSASRQCKGWADEQRRQQSHAVGDRGAVADQRGGGDSHGEEARSWRTGPRAGGPLLLRPRGRQEVHREVEGGGAQRASHPPPRSPSEHRAVPRCDNHRV
mmetsp:Transcript_53365/g.116505  ORF Transcript_53365/g.116505 Transcript_53365/m.116505 type:complete len:210 (-) Transcript_53365:376-1005(-)